MRNRSGFDDVDKTKMLISQATRTGIEITGIG